MNRTKYSRTAGKARTDCGLNSMTCPGNPQSAGHLTQEEGEEEGWMCGDGRIEEEEGERKWNCLSVQGPKLNLVLCLSSLLECDDVPRVPTHDDMYGTAPQMVL